MPSRKLSVVLDTRPLLQEDSKISLLGKKPRPPDVVCNAGVTGTRIRGCVTPVPGLCPGVHRCAENESGLVRSVHGPPI